MQRLKRSLKNSDLSREEIEVLKSKLLLVTPEQVRRSVECISGQQLAGAHGDDDLAQALRLIVSVLEAPHRHTER